MTCYRCGEWCRPSTKKCQCGCVAFYWGRRPAFSREVEAERQDRMRLAGLLGETDAQAAPIGWREITARRTAKRPGPA